MSGPNKLIAIILVLPVLASCATVVSTTRHTVPIRSEPAGAHFVITDRKGLTVQEGTTPAFVELKASGGYLQPASYRIDLTKDGYLPAHTTLYSRLNDWYFGNILFGPFCVIGFFVVDPLTGAMYRLNKQMVYEGLGRIE